jgi:CTP:molybdopterin cytidylyltransferase MocA
MEDSIAVCTVSVAAVVLAAGASRRLGRPKQKVVLGTETLLQRAVRVAQQAGLGPVLVILRDGCSLDESLSGCQTVVNPRAEEGIASSIRCGVEQARAQGVEGAVLMSCDQIALRPEHLRRLCAQADRVTGSGYDGKIGIPAYFPALSFEALLRLRGDRGARYLLSDAAFVTEEALRIDVDTEADLDHARAWLKAEEA